MGSAGEVVRVVSVCSGNTCRSPMLQGLLQGVWLGGVRDRVHTESVGVRTLAGRPANPCAVQCVRSRGVDLSTHVSTPVQELQDVQGVDLFLCMTDGHKVTLMSDYKVLEDRIMVLGIPDPVGGGEEEYEVCCQRMESQREDIVCRIEDIIRQKEDQVTQC